MWALLIVAAIVLLATPIVALVALVDARELRRETAWLKGAVASLRAELAVFKGTATRQPPEEPAADRAMPEAAAPPETLSEEPPQEELEEQPALVPPEPAQPEPAAPVAREALEEKLASRWLVWLGGVAVALAVVFLVRYSIQMGWLGPAIRCLLGASVGLAMIGGGEFLRRSPLQRAIAAVKAPQTPPVLTGAGVSALFVSIYAAYGLYDLLPPLLAFAMLAAVWAAALALSLLHGPYVAALGILGGFAVPILVQTGHPSAYSLFPYLTAVNAAALGVLRHKGWGWLAWGTLAGAAFWPVLWIDQPAALGAPAVGAYLTVTAALFIYLPAGLAKHRSPVGPPDFIMKLPRPALLAWVAATAMLGEALMLTFFDDFATGSVVWGGLLGAFLMIAGRRDETYDALAIGAAALAVLVLASWNLPEWPGYVDILDTVPPGLIPFVTAAAGYAALFGYAGFVLVRGAARPGLWAGISAATPIAILAIAYARIMHFEVDLAWATIGLFVAALNLAAAHWVTRKRAGQGMDSALAAYAVGVAAAVALAMAMALENAWLTVALALQLPAIAWIHGKTRVDALRVVALIVAGAVLTRLVFNYEVFDYALGPVPGLNWMLYGYGIPAVAFFTAALLFRRSADDRLVIALEAGALIFFVLFVSLEISDLVHHGQFLPEPELLDTSLRTIAWLAVAYWLLRRCRAEKPRAVALWGWRILGGLAVAQIVFLHLLALNPLISGDSIGGWPLLNALLLAYGAPAILALAFMIELHRQNVPLIPRIAGACGLLLVFALVTLEVRYAFHGGSLAAGPTTDVEWFAYSAAWLGYALGLLALGIWRINKPLRYASLAVLLLSVAKVFLFDMSELDGLARVVSFLVLGLSLVGIGLLYQHYVFPPGGEEETPEPQASSP